VASIALEAPPRFKLSDLATPEPTLNPGPYSPLALRYKTKISNLTGFHDLSSETISTYWDLRNITLLKDSICFSSDHSHGEADFEPSAHMIEHLERRCLAIIQSSTVHLTSSDLAVFPLFGNAALIHIMIFMRESPRRLPFARIISNRIRDSLQTIDLHLFQIQYPELMLWVLIMGGLGGVGTENQAWFAGLLAEACRVAGVCGRREIEMCVGEWLWTRLYVDEVSEGFWGNYAVCQGVEGEGEVIRAGRSRGGAGEMEVDDAPFEFVDS
jgi:hypothetical protein